MEGYGLFFGTLELIARKMENNLEELGTLPKDWDMESLKMEFGFEEDKLNEMYDFMIKVGLFYKNDNRLCNDRIIQRCDDYTARILRYKEEKVSKQSSNKVRTVSEQSSARIDKNKIDKKIIDKIYNVYEKIFNRKIIAKTKVRDNQIKNRLKTFKEIEIIKAFENASKDDFMTGSNNGKFYATIDYFIRNDQNIEKWLLENKKSEEREYWIGNKKVTKEEYDKLKESKK